ncbi:hypothetical protein A9Q84_18200 [Halobacteriovorax marinus]|uniref:Secreted protein n=1 Tax=Halobacteriovorax marinus TaxID=97084 RepID=A0A1Y5F9F9_9BACT|nr:hypothetical protein A9Q84_18200 [Halobacteriovorax marinus]
MKKINILFALFILNVSFAYAHNNEPSLEETQSWIKKELERYDHSQNNVKIKAKYLYQGCKFAFLTNVTAGPQVLITIGDYKNEVLGFDFNNLLSPRFSLRFEHGKGLLTKGYNNNVNLDDYNTYQNAVDNLSRNVRGDYLLQLIDTKGKISHLDLERMKKAMMHVIRLCHNPNEPF